mmetsp:Transcript_17943/g.37316  ORF Transcript_17943/g.37316 Transcript_17943/m.37316 type:complete len:80 (-) Transcript_17943:74-313(-)
MLEVKAAWDVLAPGGILIGDDYTKHWKGVVEDVNTFASGLSRQRLSDEELIRWDTQEAPAKQPIDGLILVGKEWLLVKG